MPTAPDVCARAGPGRHASVAARPVTSARNASSGTASRTKSAAATTSGGGQDRDAGQQPLGAAPRLAGHAADRDDLMPDPGERGTEHRADPSGTDDADAQPRGSRCGHGRPRRSGIGADAERRTTKPVIANGHPGYALAGAQIDRSGDCYVAECDLGPVRLPSMAGPADRTDDVSQPATGRPEAALGVRASGSPGSGRPTNQRQQYADRGRGLLLMRSARLAHRGRGTEACCP